MEQFPVVPEELLKALRGCSNAIICGHKNPDADCANSVLSMGHLMNLLGKQAVIVNDGAFNRPETRDFEKALCKQIPEGFINSGTLGIVVDCSTIDRLGFYSTLYSELNIAIIDHHSSGQPFGNYHYIVPESSSTTLLVYNVYKALGIPLDETSARMIFRGFATDSGFFKFLGTNCKPTFDIIGDLVTHNVAPNEEYNYINGGRPFSSVKFLAVMIDRTELLYGGRLLVSHEEESDIDEYGENARASDELYNQLLSVEGVNVVVLFKRSQKDKNCIELGFRSTRESNIDVGAIASDFGGGGHIWAAGATVAGTYEEVRARVLERLAKEF